MTLVWWPGCARLLRGQFLAVKTCDHVVAAESLGASRLRLMARHILPIAFTPLLVVSTIDLGGVVLLAASLSFIGLGAVHRSPSGRDGTFSLGATRAAIYPPARRIADRQPSRCTPVRTADRFSRRGLRP